MAFGEPSPLLLKLQTTKFESFHEPPVFMVVILHIELNGVKTFGGSEHTFNCRYYITNVYCLCAVCNMSTNIAFTK